MTERDELVDRIVAELKKPVVISANLTERVMAEVAQTPSPAPGGRPFRPRWWRRSWTIRVSPLGAVAAAAGLAGLLFASQWAGRRAGARLPEGAVSAETVAARPTQFVLVAPGAKAVSVVGDFNDWSVSATPLTRASGDGVWWVTVPLDPGRYRYAFVVDGTIWRSDPEAPVAEDEFGRPNSVMTIGGA